METADGTCKTSVPAITLGHRLCNFVYPLGVCKCLIVDNFTRFCDAKNSDFSALEDVIFGSDGRIAADVTDDPAADFAGPASGSGDEEERQQERKREQQLPSPRFHGFAAAAADAAADSAGDAADDAAAAAVGGDSADTAVAVLTGLSAHTAAEAPSTGMRGLRSRPCRRQSPADT